MTLLLATEFDWTMILWALGALATLATTVFTTISGGMWVAGNIAFKWLAEKVGPILTGHKVMVDTLNTEMPKVSQTLCALKETQIQQCKTDALHGEILTTILEEVRKSSKDTK